MHTHLVDFFNDCAERFQQSKILFSVISASVSGAEFCVAQFTFSLIKREQFNSHYFFNFFLWLEGQQSTSTQKFAKSIFYLFFFLRIVVVKLLWLKVSAELYKVCGYFGFYIVTQGIRCFLWLIHSNSNWFFHFQCFQCLYG